MVVSCEIKILKNKWNTMEHNLIHALYINKNAGTPFHLVDWWDWALGSCSCGPSSRPGWLTPATSNCYVLLSLVLKWLQPVQLQWGTWDVEHSHCKLWAFIQDPWMTIPLAYWRGGIPRHYQWYFESWNRGLSSPKKNRGVRSKVQEWNIIYK